VGRLLSCGTATKLGYSSKGDMERLEAALPGCTLGVVALVDVQPLVRTALGMHKGAAPGLRRACDCLLSVAIDKTEQTSDWERRPLTESQKAYAAVDAAILRPLYMAVLECEASPPPISAPRAATPCRYGRWRPNACHRHCSRGGSALIAPSAAASPAPARPLAWTAHRCTARRRPALCGPRQRQR